MTIEYHKIDLRGGNFYKTSYDGVPSLLKVLKRMVLVRSIVPLLLYVITTQIALLYFVQNDNWVVWGSPHCICYVSFLVTITGFDAL